MTIRGENFDVDQRYTDLKAIGGGAYGVVTSAHDKARDKHHSCCGQFHSSTQITGQKVAIKKIGNGAYLALLPSLNLPVI